MATEVVVRDADEMVAVRGLPAGQALVEVNIDGHEGTMSTPVAFDATEAEILGAVREALRGGGIQGIPAMPEADLTGFQVKPLPADPEKGRGVNTLLVRPGTGYGAA